jgi:uncharacterized protein (TIGR03084 family)
VSDDHHRFVDTLEDEQRDLEALMRSMRAEDWSRATPAAGWNICDQFSHLADTEEIAHDTVIGGPRSLRNEAVVHESGGGVIVFGVVKGRAMSAPAVGEWWIAAAAKHRDALRAANISQRVPWGLGMGWRTFVTARLMEHWAHGLDIRAALGVASDDTERLEHIGWMCYSTLSYAFQVAGVEAPSGRTLRVDVTGPSRQLWSYGDRDATDTITGPAGVWCRRGVQRIAPDAADALVSCGPLAALAVRHARAFL